LKIKRYVVRDMQEAVQLIKQDLGPDALIVSSYKVLAKGLLGFLLPRQLEVTAVLDDNPEMKLNMKSPTAQLAAGAEKQFSRSIVPAGALFLGKQNSHYRNVVDPAYSEPKGYIERPLLCSRYEEANTGTANESLHDDRGNMKEKVTMSLFDKMVSYMETGATGNFALLWRKRLLDMDVQEDIAERVLSFMEDTPDAGNHDIYVNLYKQIVHLLEPAYRSREHARVLTFIGPPGVGKTTTLAKLAIRFNLDDNKKVAMVAVNTYRIGSVEQLKAFGDFLGIPVDVVMTPAELVKVLERHKDKDYIFIDTLGRSAHNTGQILELKGFLDAVQEPQDIFLVLSLTTKNRDLNRIAREFQKIGYSKLIFSKADETETYGAILNLICTLGLPVAYLANGQGIPDDISEANPEKLARLMIRGVDPDEIMVNWY